MPCEIPRLFHIDHLYWGQLQLWLDLEEHYFLLSRTADWNGSEDGYTRADGTYVSGAQVSEGTPSPRYPWCYLPQTPVNRAIASEAMRVLYATRYRHLLPEWFRPVPLRKSA